MERFSWWPWQQWSWKQYFNLKSFLPRIWGPKTRKFWLSSHGSKQQIVSIPGDVRNIWGGKLYKALDFLELGRRIVQENKCIILIPMRISLYTLVAGIHNTWVTFEFIFPHVYLLMSQRNIIAHLLGVKHCVVLRGHSRNTIDLASNFPWWNF